MNLYQDLSSLVKTITVPASAIFPFEISLFSENPKVFNVPRLSTTSSGEPSTSVDIKFMWLFTQWKIIDRITKNDFVDDTSSNLVFVGVDEVSVTSLAVQYENVEGDSCYLLQLSYND